MNPNRAKYSTSRRVRRALVLLTGAAFMLLIASAVLDLPQSMSIAAFISFAAVATYLDLAIGKPLRHMARLDERQRAARDRAHRVAYGVMSISLLVSLIPALLLDGVVWPVSAVRTAPLLLMGLMAFVHLFLPAMILAWSEPDPVGFEAEETLASS